MRGSPIGAPVYFSDMTHVFVAPHPDDAALSCGGLIAGLRELGQNVTILTVYSGAGVAGDLTPYQREALGFGSKAIWPATEAFNRVNIANDFAVEDDGEAPPLGRRGGTPRGHAGRRGRRRPTVLAALVVVSPREHPQPADGRPAR